MKKEDNWSHEATIQSVASSSSRGNLTHGVAASAAAHRKRPLISDKSRTGRKPKRADTQEEGLKSTSDRRV